MKMSKIHKIAAALAVTFLLAGSLAAETKKEDSKEKAKPYTLKVCIVSDEKLGGDMGDPYVFVNEGQEVKLCCKSCLKDFNKDKKKFMKKLAEEEKKAKK